MLLKKTKDPAEPSSGGGAESLPSPEPEADDSTSDAGVRPIGDPGLLRTVSEFRAAIGVESPSQACLACGTIENYYPYSRSIITPKPYIVKIRIIWVYRLCSNHLESHEYIRGWILTI